MPVTVEIDRAAKVIFSTFSGELTEADFRSAVEARPTHPGFDPTFSRIVDFSNVAAANVSADFVRSMTQRSPIFAREANQVVVAPQDHVFGMARMAQMLRDQQLSNIEVVRSLAALANFWA